MARWLTQIKLYPMRFVKTLAIYFAMSAIGLSYGVIGPTLLDLKTQVSKELTEVSISLPARAGGYAAGSFLSKFSVYIMLSPASFNVSCSGSFL